MQCDTSLVLRVGRSRGHTNLQSSQAKMTAMRHNDNKRGDHNAPDRQMQRIEPVNNLQQAIACMQYINMNRALPPRMIGGAVDCYYCPRINISSFIAT
eukprot:scaffold81388_cov19-Prasinocladus_malaysianus.AAC.1